MYWFGLVMSLRGVTRERALHMAERFERVRDEQSHVLQLIQQEHSTQVACMYA